jgi:dCMP deaminase
MGTDCIGDRFVDPASSNRYPSGGALVAEYFECCGGEYPNHTRDCEVWAGASPRSEERPPREQTYMEMCHVLRKRSTCLRGKVGALLVSDRRIVATGYNGAPPGLPHCFELGCAVKGDNHVAGCQRAVHAEANVIAFAARQGQRVEGSTLYCTHGPCLKCAQLIICAGIDLVVFELPYRLNDGLELLSDAMIPWREMPPTELHIDHIEDLENPVQ